MNINSINDTCFQAKLDISKVKTNKAEWQKLAKSFNEKTQNIQGIVKVIEENSCIKIAAPIKDFACNIGGIDALIYSKNMNDLFKKFDNNMIDDKLIKLLKFSKSVDAKKEFLAQECQNMADKNSWIASDVFYDKLNKKYDAIDNITRKHLDKDEFWKHFEIIL